MSSPESLGAPVEFSEDLPTAADLRADPDFLDLADVARLNLSSLPQTVQQKATVPPPPPQQQNSSPLPSSRATVSAAQNSVFGGWGKGFSWGGLVDAVKKQSEVVVDVYKRDISELVSVVANESHKIKHTIKESINEITNPAPGTINKTVDATPEELSALVMGDMSFAGTAVPPSQTRNEESEEGNKFVAKLDDLADKADELLGKFSAGLTSFLSNAVTITSEYDDHDENNANTQRPQAAKNIVFNRKSALLASLSADPSTYTTDPSEPTSPQSPQLESELVKRYAAFRGSFAIDQHKMDIDCTLHDNPTIREMMEALVPQKVSYDDFWARYLFRVAEAERKEQLRKRLMSNTETNDEEDQFSWGSEDEDDEKQGARKGQRSAVEGSKEEGGAPSTISQVGRAGEEGSTENRVDLAQTGNLDLASGSDATIPASEPTESQTSSVGRTELQTSSVEVDKGHVAAKRSIDSFEVLSAKGDSPTTIGVSGEEDDDWGDWE